MRETVCIYSLPGMRNLFSAARVLLLDLASSILFGILLVVTGNLLLAVGLGMVLGGVQIGWQHTRKQPIGSLQWLSVALILLSGTATFFTHDPRFVMLKPSIIYCIIGAVMLKRGWMTRYLPERAAPVLDVATMFGYVWAGLMFATAALNLVLATRLDPATGALFWLVWGVGSKAGLFLVQYSWMMAVGRRRAAAASLPAT